MNFKISRCSLLSQRKDNIIFMIIQNSIQLHLGLKCYYAIVYQGFMLLSMRSKVRDILIKGIPIL